MFKNPLLKHNINKTKGIWVGYIVIVAIMAIVILSGTSSSILGNEGTTLFMKSVAKATNRFMVIGILLSMAGGVVAASDYGSKESEEFLSGLPYRKASRWRCSFIPLFMVICASILLLCISAVVSYNIHYTTYSNINIANNMYVELMQADSLGNGLIAIIKTGTIWLMVYSLTSFTMYISRNKIAAFAVLGGLLIAPYLLAGVINNVSIRYFNYIMPWYNDVMHSLGISYIASSIVERSSGIYQVAYSENNFSIIIAMVSVTVVSILLGRFAVVGRDRTFGKLLINKFYETVLIIMAGIYTAFLVPAAGMTHKLSFGSLLAVMCIVFVITEIILFVIFSQKGRYTYLNAGGNSYEK